MDLQAGAARIVGGDAAIGGQIIRRGAREEVVLARIEASLGLTGGLVPRCIPERVLQVPRRRDRGRVGRILLLSVQQPREPKVDDDRRNDKQDDQ